MGTTNDDTTPDRLPRPLGRARGYERELDRQLFVRLRESECDLQAELSDLAQEIQSRIERVRAVQIALGTNREHQRRLLRDADAGADA